MHAVQPLPHEELHETWQTDIKVRLAALESAIALLGERLDMLGDENEVLKASVQRLFLGPEGTFLDIEEAKCANAAREQSEEQAPRAASEQSSLSLPTSVDRVYRLQSSIWDVVLFFGAGSLGCWNSIFAALAFVLTVVIQGVMVMQIQELVDTEVFGEAAKLDLLSWRMNIGHDVAFWSATTNTSLVERICGGEYFADGQGGPQIALWRDALSRVRNADDLFSGAKVLTVLCVIMWMTLTLDEVVSAIRYSQAVCSFSHLHSVDVRAHRSTFGSPMMVHTRTILCLVFVCVPRAFIALGLGFSGVRFLVYTQAQADLVLNAMALGFILDLDELFFRSIVPMAVHSMISAAEPIPLVHLHRCLEKLPDLVPLAGVTLLVASVPLTFLTGIDAVFADTQRVVDAMCAGQRDFVCSQDSAIGVVTCAKTASWPGLSIISSGIAGFYSHAVLSEMNLPGDVGAPSSSLSSNPVFWSTVGSVREVSVRASQDIANQELCTDSSWSTHDKGGRRMDAFRSLLEQLVNDGTLDSFPDTCEDAAANHGCQELGFLGANPFRTVCPVSCSCDRIDDGLFDRHSCPTDCAATRDGYREKVVCGDWSTEKLSSDEEWELFFRQLDGYFSATFGIALNATEISKKVGCEVSNHFDDVQSICNETERGNQLFGGIETFCPDTCNFSCIPSDQEPKPPRSSG